MTARARNAEWSRYYLVDETNEAAALHARFVAHRYGRHAHEYCVVGLVDSGVQSYVYRGSRHITSAGDIFVVNPGEPHTGESATSAGYIYRTLYLSQKFLARVLEDLGERGRPPPSLYLKGAVHTDPTLARSLCSFHRALEHCTPRIEQESMLLRALAILFTRYSELPPKTPRVGTERGSVARACDYMQAHFDRNVSLTDLANIVGLSPFYLSRVFEKEVGLPPHAYLEGVRIREACALLDRGETIAVAALAVGYADQSHLTKRFKRFLGITPGQYDRAHKRRVSTAATQELADATNGNASP